MSECWAKSHTPCGLGASREHYISAGLFDQPTIFVQGFDWCPEEKEIGIGALTSKILCRKHNSILSGADMGGIRAVQAIDLTTDPAGDTLDELNGLSLERWLLKTAINVTFRGKQKLGIGMRGAEIGYPAPYLLEAVFGGRVLEYKMGVYVLFPKGQYLFRKGEIVVVPIHKEGEIGGLYFNLRGVHFFLSLFPGHAPPSLRELGMASLPDHVLDAVPVYRPQSVVIPKPSGATSTITLAWSQ
ncbi:MAG: hypothetical protein VYC42_05325 [Pseudomonadota bacterium]|nr:hypothetical protein [Pseudomonadota bacterium]